MTSPTRLPVLLSLALVLLACPSLSTAGKGVGEVDIPKVIPLNPEQLQRMRALVRSDPEAAALAAEMREAAEPHLLTEPRPLVVIHYEGLVNTDPKRLATVKNLADMRYAGYLYRHWQASGDRGAERALRRHILAWADTYQVTGNDVNENKFHPLLCAYASLRDTFFPDERERVDAWVEALAREHVREVENPTRKDLTNRYTKRVRLAATLGLILNREEWIDAAIEGTRRFIRESLRADGSSWDLEHRDSLTYHISALRNPIDIAIVLNDRDLYTWESKAGGSLKKSVDFVVPYATGEKEHEEWVNSKVDLDRRRAEAGLEKYRPGRIFEPKRALSLLEKAAYFDPSLMEIVRDLSDSEAERFPTWQTLVNAAARADTRG